DAPPLLPTPHPPRQACTDGAYIGDHSGGVSGAGRVAGLLDRGREPRQCLGVLVPQLSLAREARRGLPWGFAGRPGVPEIARAVAQLVPAGVRRRDLVGAGSAVAAPAG